MILRYLGRLEALQILIMLDKLSIVEAEESEMWKSVSKLYVL